MILHSEEEKDLARALETLNSGGLILYPTDTIWGIGCDATNENAVSRVFNLKNRASAKAMISLVDSIDTLYKWIDHLPDAAIEEIRVSSSPLTIIYDSPHGLASNLIAEDGSAAFRIPAIEFTKHLCKRFGKPVVSSSANISGCPAPQTFSEIPEEILKNVDYVCFTGRSLPPSKPSRILKIANTGSITVIR